MPSNRDLVDGRDLNDAVMQMHSVTEGRYNFYTEANTQIVNFINFLRSKE
jgi:hypothetical protein